MISLFLPIIRIINLRNTSIQINNHFKWGCFGPVSCFAAVQWGREVTQEQVKKHHRNVENVEDGGLTKTQLRWSGRARRVTRPLTHDCVCLVSDVEKSTRRGEKGGERSRRGGKMNGEIQRGELTQKVQRKSINDLGHTWAGCSHPAGLKHTTRSCCGQQSLVSPRKDTLFNAVVFVL